ncbi:hypothetical protein [Streptomyces sp. NBC_01477]|uniref:hypothetical protein n=1 Tax=Streptomyces sp. NBC_01477 TaxID=2976015 RepID=UPI002E317EC3|nr:hypothetical protein [Streptomyces sp. NBC_01477]
MLAHRCRDGADAASAAASDGTVSDELRQHVAKGARSTAVTLLWSFDGPGSLTATATLDVLGPQQRSAATTFSYRCAG